MNGKKMAHDFFKGALKGLVTAAIAGLTIVLSNADSYFEKDNNLEE